MKQGDLINQIVDINEQIVDITSHYCNYDCEYFDNGIDCNPKCHWLIKLKHLTTKSDNLLKTNK